MNNIDDPLKYKQIYMIKDYVTIKNFLTSDYAEQFHKFLKNMDQTWWYHTSVTKNGKKEIRNMSDNSIQTIITERRKNALELFAQSKEFSYSFYRTIGNHYEECNCFLCNFDDKIIRSEQFKNLIEKITDKTNLKLGTYFYTEYRPGDFLYPHTDKPNGRVALVLYLTKNWKPWYGGNLCILDNQWKNVRETLTPKFNSMTIMKIEENTNPHFVEYIPQNVIEKRFAMVCWFT